MKNKLFAFLTALLFCVPSLSYGVTISGNMMMGKTGEPYVINGKTWQNARIQTDAFKITAALPGSPRSGMQNSLLSVQSDYEGTNYFVKTDATKDDKPPATAQTFIQEMSKNNPGEFHAIACKKNHMRYAVEFIYKNENGEPGITRIYVTKRKMFLVGAMGNDLSLAEQFFDSFNIEKI